MIRRTMVAVGLLAMLTGSAWADTCPLCLQEIPKGDKYCTRHKQEQAVKTMTANDEKKVLDELAQARNEYKARMDKVKDFYVLQARARESDKIRAEIDWFNATPHFSTANWEDTLPEISATTPTPEADQLLKEAQEAQKGWNPLKSDERIKAAAAKYQEIVLKYPKSTAVEQATYALGDIYSSRGVAEYARGVRLFDLCYLSNPNTSLDALYRAAKVSNNNLADYESAARYYWLAARTTKDPSIQKSSAAQLKVLQKNRFGTSYVLEEKPAEPK